MRDWAGRFPRLAPALAGAHHVDVHSVQSDKSLREFVAGMMGHQPSWLRFLYRVRAWFVLLLGMRQEQVAVSARWTPSQVPMRPGEAAAFFTVRETEEDRLWVVEAEDRHLRASLAVVREAAEFSLVTIVHYRHWTGPVYFNVIRPFHHLVVASMARAGARGALAPST